jgi:intracellular proteinase inhibitor BsuPI
MMARLALAVGAATLSSGYSSCTFISGDGSAIGTGGGPNAGTGYQTTLVLRDSTGTNTSSFVMGEPIRFDLEIRNLDNVAKTLQFPDSQIYDFYVLEAGTARLRWRWSEGMAFSSANSQLLFTASSSRSYSVLWNGVLRDGTQLPAGNYRARGVIVAEDFAGDPLRASDLGSNVVDFTVR